MENMLIDFNNLNINQLSFHTEFEKKVETFLKEWVSDGAMVKVQTSGSTGVPKIFEIEKVEFICIEKYYVLYQLESTVVEIGFHAKLHVCVCFILSELRMDRFSIDRKKRAHSHKASSATKLHYLAS